MLLFVTWETDINYVVLENLYDELKDKADFYFDTPVSSITHLDKGYSIHTEDEDFECKDCIVSVGRSRKQVDGTGLPRNGYTY